MAAFTTRLMLAGGLTPDNVGARAAALRPWGVDVASGVEDGTPGRKDADKMRAFVEAVKRKMNRKDAKGAKRMLFGHSAISAVSPFRLSFAFFASLRWKMN